MRNDDHVLIITDDENSRLVRMLLRLSMIPIIRRSIISALDLLRHMDILAIIIDKKHQDVDTLEFVLNAKDVTDKIPIFIPEQYQNREDWDVLRKLGKIRFYNETDPLLKEQIENLVTDHNATIKDY